MQVKRIHEYKRQLLNVLGIIHRYLRIKEMAPEYYDNLYAHKSWSGLVLRFLFDPSVGLHSRVQRTDRSGTPAVDVPSLIEAEAANSETANSETAKTETATAETVAPSAEQPQSTSA